MIGPVEWDVGNIIEHGSQNYSIDTVFINLSIHNFRKSVHKQKESDHDGKVAQIALGFIQFEG